VRQRYSNKKQIRIDYETQFSTDPMLNDKIKKNQLKIHKKTTRVNLGNLLNTIHGLWD
jgi:hypothetical protein